MSSLLSSVEARKHKIRGGWGSFPVRSWLLLYNPHQLSQSMRKIEETPVDETELMVRKFRSAVPNKYLQHICLVVHLFNQSTYYM